MYVWFIFSSSKKKKYEHNMWDPHVFMFYFVFETYLILILICRFNYQD
jgi:hypothetical protein